MTISIGKTLRAWSAPLNRSVPVRYGAAVLLVAAAVAVRFILFPVIGIHAPYLPFTLAGLVAAWLGGRGPGLVATAISALWLAWFVLEPTGSFLVADRSAAAGLALFVVVGALASLLVSHLTSRRLAEQEASRANEQLKLALESANMGTWDFDVSTGQVTWDERSRALLGVEGCQSNTLPGTLDIIHPDDRRRINEKIQGALDPVSDGKFEAEFRVLWPDGSVEWILAKAAARFEGEGAARKAARLVGTMQSITARKQSEQALRESEERLRLAQLVGRIGTFDWNIQSGLNRWTPELEAMYGLPAGGFPGTYGGWEELIHPDDRIEAVGRVREAMETGRFEGEWRVNHPDGTVHWLAGRGSAFKDEFGKPARLIGVNIDITETKRAADALRQASEQRRLALEAANLGSWEVPLDGGKVSLDDRCARLFGLPAGGQVDYNEVLARIHPDDRAATKEAMNQALAGASNGAYDRQYRVIWPDASVHWVASHGRAFFEGDGENRRAVRFTGVNMEITERRQAEERLRQTQKLESISVLAGGVAHDFNNLLTVITISAGAALDECPSCSHSQAILSAAGRAADLTKQLLAYAGKSQRMVMVVDISELVAQTARLLSASLPKRTSLSVNVSRDGLRVEADPSQVEQILMNLVINAGEAIPPKSEGRIEIAAFRCEITPEMARSHSRAYDVAAGPYVCLEVRDNGAGMDDATKSRIFDPFFSTKFTGRGLGLAAVYGIVRNSKGFIDVHSSVNAGTTFRVFLPASEKECSTEPTLTAPHRQTRGAATILVVEDEEVLRQLACMTLRRRGYEVLEAKDGKEALEILAGAPSLPSLVFLDLAMPIMGGDELAPILAEKYPDLNVIMSSGYPEEEARRNFAARSITGFLQKPYTVGELTEKVREALARSPEQRAIHRVGQIEIT